MPDSSTPIEPVADETAAGTGLARAKDVLPGVIHILPNPARPLFPGAVAPVVLSASDWESTIKAVGDSEHKVVGVVYTGKPDLEETGADDLTRMGTACRIHRVDRADDKYRLILTGEQRFTVSDWISRRPPFKARVKYHPDIHDKDVTGVRAYVTAIINTIKELLPLNPLYGEELKVFMQHYQPDDPSRLADFGATLTTSNAGELQEVLEAVHIPQRLEKAYLLLRKELEVAKAQMEIKTHVETEMQSRQREVFLREQLKFIQKELGISKDDRTAEAEKFETRIAELTLPEGAKKRIDEEMEKLKILETGSPEYTVTRNYLDWLTNLPWGRYTEDDLDLHRAAEVMDADHEGLTDVKERILEFLGVGKFKGEIAGSILLFVGPPGVGKTSLGRSIAAALKRKFYRFSLGGMRDEAEIKGHRRTYIGAMPGKFIQAIKETESANPVIMLDEVDKIGASFHGDPASALLEVLDPEQNNGFLDHYLDVRFDLSKVLFICTANQLDTIPGPLLDRMEVIQLSGYLAAEKERIATGHLLPRQLERAGLSADKFHIERAAIMKIIEDYAREAGVRRLEKLLGKIIRKSVMKIIKDGAESVTVGAGDIEGYLGAPVFHQERSISGVGAVTGLAWTPMGGVTLTVEATKAHGFARGFKLTGQLGDVMKESAEIAYSYVVGNAGQFGASPKFFEEAFVHLHVPAGATPKDGPSAGVTMATALISLAKREPVPRLVAMTGELTLTGHVLRIGGVKEKILAARRMDIREIILPEENRGDYAELPDDVVEGIEVKFVSTYMELFRHLWT